MLIFSIIGSKYSLLFSLISIVPLSELYNEVIGILFLFLISRIASKAYCKNIGTEELY